MPVAALNAEGLSALTNLPMMASSSAHYSACWAFASSATKCVHSCSACIAGSPCAQGLTVTVREVWTGMRGDCNKGVIFQEFKG